MARGKAKNLGKQVATQSTQYDPEVYDEDSQEMGEGKTGRGSRGQSFTVSEDMIICSNYVRFTENPIAGVHQDKATLWGSIYDQFEQETMNVTCRTEVSLCNHFVTINAQVQLFVAAIVQAERRRQSGEGDTDVELRCREAWKREHGKPFAYEECYHILKVLPKYDPKMLLKLKSVPKASPYNQGSPNSQGSPSSPFASQFPTQMGSQGAGGSGGTGGSGGSGGNGGSGGGMTTEKASANALKFQMLCGRNQAKKLRQAKADAAVEGKGFNMDTYTAHLKETSKERSAERKVLNGELKKSRLSQEKYVHNHDKHKIMNANTSNMNDEQLYIWKMDYERIKRQMEAERLAALESDVQGAAPIPSVNADNASDVEAEEVSPWADE